jgi:SHS2 domain-containing protein
MSPTQLQFLEHTADVGFDVSADTLPELFERAAAGMFVLLLGDAPAPPEAMEQGREVHRIRLQAAEPALLLAAWLRELLYLYESEGLRPVITEFRTLDERELDAMVTWARPSAAPLREIKGVTYHQLYLRQERDGWRGRVIFDV